MTQLEKEGATRSVVSEKKKSEYYTVDSKITDVIQDVSFDDYGRLIFPMNEEYYKGETLGQLQLIWYNNIDSVKTVEIVNCLKERADAGESVFYDIYTGNEKKADPAKEDTGLFFFRGDPGAKFAVCNAGGGFAYVEPCRTVFLMRWSFPKKVTMPLF